MTEDEKQRLIECYCAKKLTGSHGWRATFMMTAGVALGATAMYFFDPNRGKARRGDVRQRTTRLARHGGRILAKHADDLLNRAKGAVAGASAALCPREQTADDIVTSERVRSRLGHVTEHATAIQTEVASGVVTLRGAVPKLKHRQVVDEVLMVPGVTGVRDHMVSISLA